MGVGIAGKRRQPAINLKKGQFAMNGASKPRGWIFCLVLAGLCLAFAPAMGQATSPAAQPTSDGAPATIPAKRTTKPATMASWTRTVFRAASTQSSRPASRSATAASTSAFEPMASTLDGCAKQYNRGSYSSAAAGYRKLLDKHGLVAALGLADALAMEGKYNQALEALSKFEAPGQADAKWQLAMARLLETLGKYEGSLGHSARACELRPGWAPAIYSRGIVLETLGRKQQAVELYRGVERIVADEKYRSEADSLVAVGQIMDRLAILTGRRASDQAQNILQNYLQDAYLKVDKSYWPANVAAAQFLLANHRPKQALTELGLAEKINRRIPDVLVGKAIASLEEWDFEKCLKQVDSALAINPHHAEALLVKAVCMMQWRKTDEVRSALDAVLKINPNRMEALSMMAALHIRHGSTDAAQPFIDRAAAIDAKAAIMPSTIGEFLSSQRQFAQAEKYYLQAIELAPELAGPRTGLGLLYMQTGQEQQARDVLKKAHEIDDFREDVVNYLSLLDKLLDESVFLVKESEHFIVKVDAKADRVLLDQVSQYMEDIYGEICGDHSYQLAGKTIVEIFPTHSQFSVRISGRGWVGTIGACTGNVIALAAPNKDRSSGTHNWAMVLRHEYTHAVTLAATNNRIPHWLTEAFAVHQQPDRRAWQYVRMLVDATRRGELFSVKDIDWGFIRPKRPGDRGLAYAQSEWMLDFIIQTRHYNPTIANLIKAFADGQTQAQAFEQVLATTQEQFDKDFQAWAKTQVKQWGFDPAPPADLSKAGKEVLDRPDDSAVQGRYAAALFNNREYPKAREAAKRALELDQTNAKALAVLAYACFMLKDYDEAIRQAKALEELDHASIHSPKILAQCYLEKRSWSEAIAALELFQQRQPLDQFSYENLARIYTELGQGAKALPNLLELHRRTMDDPQYARRIADIYRSTGQEQLALDFYKQAVQINPYELSTYEAMAAIYLKLKDYPQALATARNLPILEPKSALAWNKAAMVEFFAGRNLHDMAILAQARQSAERAQELEPDGQAKQILERIDDAMREAGQ